MKIKLPFRIGKDYEIWEYHLEIKEDKLKNYDSYNFLEKVDFLGLSTENIELIFNYDVLQAVILIFEYAGKENLTDVKTKINSKLGESKPLRNKYLTADIYTLGGELELWFIHNPSNYTIEIRYGHKKILRGFNL